LDSVFFSAMAGTAGSLVREEEARTAPALRLAAPPELVYVGKLVFNFLLLTALAGLLVPLYLALMAPPLGNAGLLLLVLVLGLSGLAGVTTILAAMVARAGAKSVLLPVLAFPLLLPVLAAAIGATAAALAGEPLHQARGELQFLVSYGVVVITTSLLLFGYVWND